MLGKSSVLMMLLLGTGSLLGISSIYIPANVETQPQQQPQPTPQPQKPQTTLEARNPGLSTELTTGQRVVDPQVLRAMEENQLLNRLMPKIVERLQVTLNFRDNYSPVTRVDKGALSSETHHMAEARCPPGFRVTGGGGQISSNLRSPPSGLWDYKQDVADNNIAALMIIPTSRLDVVAKMETSGSIMAIANCLGVEAVVSLRK